MFNNNNHKVLRLASKASSSEVTVSKSSHPSFVAIPGSKNKK